MREYKLGSAARAQVSQIKIDPPCSRALTGPSFAPVDQLYSAIEKSDKSPPTKAEWGYRNKAYHFRELTVPKVARVNAVFHGCIKNGVLNEHRCSNNLPYRISAIYDGEVFPERTYFKTMSDGTRSWKGLKGAYTTLFSQIERNAVPLHVKNNILNDHTRQIKDVRLDLGVELRELPETAYFLRNAIKGPLTLLKGVVVALTKALSYFRKGELRKTARHLGLKNWWHWPKKTDKDIVLNDLNKVGTYTAEKWLEFKYGWMPLVYSVQDAYDELRRVITEKKYIKTYGGYKDEIPFTYLQPGIHAWQESFHRTSGTMKRRYKSGCTWEITGLPEGAELGLLKNNLENIVWQGLFLSFMVDAFWNVSSFLQAARAPLGAKWVDGYETTFLRYKGTYAVDSVEPMARGGSYTGSSDPYVEVLSKTPGVVSAVYFERKVLGSRPVCPPIPWFGDLDAEYFGTVAALWKNFYLKPER